MTFNIRPGDIYKLPFPFSDLSTRKARPALALSKPDRNGDSRFLFITTTPVSSTEEGYRLEASDFAGQPLPFPSHLRLDKPFLLHESLVLKHLATLQDDSFKKILRRLVTLEIPAFAALALRPPPFEPGKTVIPAAGKVIDQAEMHHMVEAALDGWLTTGRFNEAFQKQLAAFLGVKHVITVNSGSSANLIALSSLTSPKLADRAIQPGDEVITVAAGFPTTVNPILQVGAVPVFLDVELATYNIDVSQLEAAISPRTKAIMLAHTLGNPFNLDAVTKTCQQHNLWLVEDCCDALGSTYRGQPVGTFGDIATLSFYPAHHITMGEGGAVFTNNATLKLIAESFRDWGRDCFCPPGKDNTCKKRFAWQLGQLPAGYDHKYIYSHLGYNLKITDMQAACGLAQLNKLPDFIARRREHFARLSANLAPYADQLILPTATRHSNPSWFGFPITLQGKARGHRLELLQQLTKHNIGTRLLFGGNLTKQPYFENRRYREIGTLEKTNRIMSDTFWVGLYPGLVDEAIDYTASILGGYVSQLERNELGRTSNTP